LKEELGGPACPPAAVSAFCCVEEIDPGLFDERRKSFYTSKCWGATPDVAMQAVITIAGARKAAEASRKSNSGNCVLTVFPQDSVYSVKSAASWIQHHGQEPE